MDTGDVEHSAGPMSHVSYDSHVVTRARMVDTLPRLSQQDSQVGNKQEEEDMEGEILKVWTITDITDNNEIKTTFLMFR